MALPGLIEKLLDKRTVIPGIVFAVVLFASGAALAQDLSITYLKANHSGSTAYSGASFTTAYTMRNGGNAFTTNFYVYFYYCTSTTSSSCTNISNTLVKDNFSKNQSRTYYKTLTVPTYATHGTGYVRVYADAYKNYVKETNENNNDKYGSFSVSTRPDLYVYQSWVPYTGTTATIGSSFSARYRIYNKSNTSKLTSDFYIRYYYCPAQSTSGCTSLATQYVTTDINSGSYIYLNSIALAVPLTAKNGKAYIRADLDYNNAVVESNEGNNRDYDEITVTDIPADLVVSAANAGYSGSTAYVGSSFTTQYTIRNAHSKQLVNKDFYMYFYWCTSASATSCTYLTGTLIKDDFNAGQSRIYYQTLTVPTYATYGKAHIRFYVDAYKDYVKETNNNNNDRYDGVSVLTKPDLYVYQSWVPYTGSTAGVGSSFVARYRIYNAAKTSKLTQNFNVRYYYCHTQSSAQCSHIGTQYVTTDINSGSYFYLNSITLSIPKGAQNGTRYIRAFLDYDNKVAENNEKNNEDYDPITVSGVPTDLRVSQTSAPYSGTTAHSGSSFTTQYTLWNDSGSALISDFYVYFYWCTSTIATSCTYVSNTLVKDDFNASQKRTYYKTLTVPTYATYGTGYVRVFADAYKNYVKETNENNNDAYDSVSVSTRPDLYFYQSWVPYTGSTTGPGSSFTARYRIYNASKTSKLTDNFTIRYYYCPGQTSSGCTSLGNHYVTTDINSGSYIYLNSISLAIPAGAQNGTRYIRAYLDYDNKVKENNEANNEDYDEITVSGVPTDLRITSTTAPVSGSTAAVGSGFTVKADIHNNSKNYLITDFYIYYYYCPTKTYNANCTYLSNTLVKDNFNAQQVRSYYKTLTVPVTAVYGTGYIYFHADGYKNLVKETNENNNTAWDDINLTKRPDLYVYQSWVPYTGSTYSVGSTFTARYRVYNAAKTSKLTENFNVRYYYCPNKSSTGCTTIGTQQVSTDINSGSYIYFVSITLAIPSGAQNGTRYIRAYLDYDNKVKESNEGNNEDYDDIKITSVPVDLRITSTAAPYSGSTAGAGSSFTAMVKLYNDSTLSFTNNFYVYYYYCPTKSSTGCTNIGNTYVTDNFSSKQSRTYYANLKLPNSVMYGAGYIRFYADATNAISESNEGNNQEYDGITVKTRPDLSITSSSVPYSGNTNGTGSVFTGRYTVTNTASTSRNTGDFVMRYYYCPNKGTTGCVQLGDQTVTTNLDSGKSTTFNSISLTLPAGVSSGARYIRAFVDATTKVAESNETNNDDYDEIKIISGDPDLKITSTSAPATGSTAGAGSSFTASAVVQNANGSSFTTDFYMYYYYCLSTSASSCVQIGSLLVTDNFAGNQSRTITSPKLVMPDTAQYGSGYIRFHADATGAIKESDETNNNSYDAINVTALPDLMVSSSTVPTTGKPGDTFVGKYTITNAASSSAFSKNFSVSYFYCATNTANTCVLIGKQTVTNNFNSGGSYSFSSVNLKIPTTATSGTRYIRVQIDSDLNISESNEGNNDKFDAITISGTTNPDLIISTIKIAASGSTVDYTVSVCNNGDATTKTFDLELYYNRASAPTCLTSSDHQWIVSGLGKNKCLTYNHTRLNVNPGPYLGWARADADCAVKEADENNNNMSSAYTVGAGADASVEAGPVDAGPEVGPGPEMGPGPEAGPGPEMGPGPDAGPEAGPQPEAGPGPEAGTPEAGPGPEAGTDAQLEGGADEAGPQTEAGPQPEAGTDGAGQEAGPKTEAGTGDISVNPEAGSKTDGTVTPPGEEDGCNCQVGGDPASGLGLLMLLGLLLGLRRRRG